MLNEDNQQNVLNAFTKVNEFKNKIITKKYIINSKEKQNILNTINPEENYPVVSNILINENISQIKNSPISLNEEKEIIKHCNNIENNTVVKNNIPVKINILNLKKIELSSKDKGKLYKNIIFSKF